MYKNFLYATTISKTDRDLKKAIAIAKKYDANIKILHVIKPIRSFCCNTANMNIDHELEKETYKKAVEDLNKMLIKFNGIPYKILFGSPVKSILNHAENNNFDTIILNGHTHNIFLGFLSTVDRVINKSKQDVIVLRQ